MLLFLFSFCNSGSSSNANRTDPHSCGNLCSVDWWKTASPEDMVKELKTYDLKVFLKKNHSNIFSTISIAGHPETIKVFLENGGENYINRASHGWTPLAEVVRFRGEKTPELIRLYVSHGAKVNLTPFGSVIDSRRPPGPGHNIFSRVLHYGDPRPLDLKIKIVQTLLEVEADPRGPSPGNARTAVGIACSDSKWPLVEVMISASTGFKWSEICGLPEFERGKNVRCAHLAMANHDDEVVDQALAGLKREGFTVKNFPASAQGNTLLHYAASLGSIHTMKKLIREGADITAMNNSGRSPQQMLKNRLKHYKEARQDEELLKMMELPLPFSTKIRNFFR